MNDAVDPQTGEIAGQAVVVPVVRPPAYQTDQIGQLAAALAEAQGQMEAPKKTKTGKVSGTTKGSGRSYEYEYKYAPFEEVVRCAKTIAVYGLSFQQGLVTRGGLYFVRTYLRHSSGEWAYSDYPVIIDRDGPQGFASATTYAKRYGLCLALGLAAEDDDGAQDVETKTPAADLDSFAAAVAVRRGRPAKTQPPTAQPQAHYVNAFSKDQPPPENLPEQSNKTTDDLLRLANEKGAVGYDALRDWYYTLNNDDRLFLRPHIDALQAKARRADIDKIRLADEHP